MSYLPKVTYFSNNKCKYYSHLRTIKDVYYLLQNINHRLIND